MGSGCYITMTIVAYRNAGVANCDDGLSNALLHAEAKSSLSTGPACAGGALVVSGIPSLSLVTILQCLLPQFPLLPVLLR
jgi:hypothetical protein